MTQVSVNTAIVSTLFRQSPVRTLVRLLAIVFAKLGARTLRSAEDRERLIRANQLHQDARRRVDALLR